MPILNQSTLGSFQSQKRILIFNQYYKPGDYFPAKILPLPRH